MPLTIHLSQPESNGFILAWIILIGLGISLIYTGFRVWRGYQAGGAPSRWAFPQLRFAIPILALAGLGIAGYLTYIEVSATQAFCGPVGDCNAVQNSPYSRLFGIPLGIVGLAGYGLILGGWLWGQRRSLPLAEQMPLIVFCAALFSVLYSMYLTYLELFVINAVCIWCLSSAVLTGLILVASVQPMLEAGEGEEAG